MHSKTDKITEKKEITTNSKNNTSSTTSTSTSTSTTTSNNNNNDDKSENEKEETTLLLEMRNRQQQNQTSSVAQQQQQPNTYRNCSNYLAFYRTHKVPTMKWMFGLHFMVALAVVCGGALKNGGGRKYVPLDVSKYAQIYPEQKCKKGYINVLASSSDEPGAIVCCDGSHDPSSWFFNAGELYDGGLCVPTPRYLRFANIITKFPHSWLIPFFPMFWRVFIAFFTHLAGRPVPESNSLQITFNRSVLYLSVMMFRGFILYWMFNVVENSIVMVSQGVGISDDNDEESCWYQDFLKYYNRSNNCHGRQFDYSDHVVLFLSHYLPCLVFEWLYCYLFPFWKGDRVFRPSYHQRISLPIVLALMFFYINFLTFLAIHRTAAYFHTPAETAVGYLISLCVQVPLGFLILSERWGKVRRLVGLPTE